MNFEFRTDYLWSRIDRSRNPAAKLIKMHYWRIVWSLRGLSVDARCTHYRDMLRFLPLYSAMLIM